MAHRGREQACACPPAQIPACTLTHGAPASNDDERPLVRPRALKPVAVTRETPTQGLHRKCVLHYLNRQCRVVVSTDRLGVDPQRPYRLGDPDPLGWQHSECKTPFRVSLRSFSYPVEKHATESRNEGESAIKLDLPSFVLETPFHRAATERPAGLICVEKIGLARRRLPPTALPSHSGSESSAECATPLHADQYGHELSQIFCHFGTYVGFDP